MDGSRSQVAAEPDDGIDVSVIHLPIIMRRWPPVPYAPILAGTGDPLWDAPVRLDWAAEAPLVTYPIETYTVEESLSSDFSTADSYTVLTTSVPYTVPAKPFGTMGTYFYRVRAQNAWGPSEWSNVVSALLLSQRDEFTHPETGWAPVRTSYWDLETMAADYGANDLVTRVEDRFDFAIFSPLRPAPEPPYAIKMRTQILHKANETSFGIVFGGNEGSFCGVTRWNAADPNGCFSHYYRLNVIWGGYLKVSLSRIDEHAGIAGGGQGSGDSGGYSALDWWEARADGWNEWEIRVYDTGFEAYVNGYYIGGRGDTLYLQDPYYGIFSSTYEYNGARFVHDYFYVEPLPSGATMQHAQPEDATGTGPF